MFNQIREKILTFRITEWWPSEKELETLMESWLDREKKIGRIKLFRPLSIVAAWQFSFSSKLVKLDQPCIWRVPVTREPINKSLRRFCCNKLVEWLTYTIVPLHRSVISIILYLYIIPIFKCYIFNILRLSRNVFVKYNVQNLLFRSW